MAQERLTVRKIREILRLKYEAGLSNRAIAGACNISNSTVGEYLRRAEAAGIGWPLGEISEEELVQKPSAQPEVKEVPPLLRDFKALWKSLKSFEKKALLRVMFVAIYFDQDGKIRKISANKPFEKLVFCEILKF